MYMDNWRPGGMGWMDLDLVGQQSGALVAFVPPVSIKYRSLHGPWSIHRFLSRAYTCLWEREDLFLSCHGFRLFLGRLFRVVIYILGWGGLSTILRPGLQCWGLRVRAWMGTWTRWQEWNGLVLLVPGVQARRVFRGTQLGTLIRESPILRDGTAWLRSGIVVRTGSWKMKKWFLLLNPAWL
jgi:hypothetical protein